MIPLTFNPTFIIVGTDFIRAFTIIFFWKKSYDNFSFNSIFLYLSPWTNNQWCGGRVSPEAHRQRNKKKWNRTRATKSKEALKQSYQIMIPLYLVDGTDSKWYIMLQTVPVFFLPLSLFSGFKVDFSASMKPTEWEKEMEKEIYRDGERERESVCQSETK